MVKMEKVTQVVGLGVTLNYQIAIKVANQVECHLEVTVTVSLHADSHILPIMISHNIDQAIVAACAHAWEDAALYCMKRQVQNIRKLLTDSANK